MSAACPLCGSLNAVMIEDRPKSPVFQNKLYPTQAAARAALTGPLTMTGCRDCDFVWNRAYDPALLSYEPDYENDQTFSPAFEAHVKAMIGRILAAHPPGPIHVLEVGCGQGRFIELFLKETAGREVLATGFDPAWRGAEGSGPPGSGGRARLYRRLFDRNAALALDRPPSVVVCRHTIEHVTEPVGFLAAIRAALDPAWDPPIFLETPSVAWILDNAVLHDFFYEHCSLFTPRSLTEAITRAGLIPRMVSDVFDGQYLWAEAGMAGQGGPTPAGRLDFKGAHIRHDAYLARWRAAVAAAAQEGPVAIWGAGAKGVTFAQLVDPEAKLVRCMVDVNPGKQGHFLPGTGHPIESPAAAKAFGIETAFIMNPVYAPEIRAAAQAQGWALRCEVVA